MNGQKDTQKTELETLKELFIELNKTIEAAKKEMSSKAKILIESAANELFKVAPEIDHVFWTQYTPYFNDGEACYFSVHEPYFVLNIDLENDDTYSEGSYLYDEKDYANAKTALEEAIAYEKDPKAWQKEYKDKYYKNTGRSYTGNIRWVKPYPDNKQDALNNLTRIEKQFELLSIQDVTRINNAFSAFVGLIYTIPEDIIKVIYGDHVRVTINKNRTEVDEYYHE